MELYVIDLWASCQYSTAFQPQHHCTISEAYMQAALQARLQAEEAAASNGRTGGGRRKRMDSNGPPESTGGGARKSAQAAVRHIFEKFICCGRA